MKQQQKHSYNAIDYHWYWSDEIMEQQKYRYNSRFYLCKMGFYETCYIRDTQKGHFNILTWERWFDIYSEYIWYDCL